MRAIFLFIFAGLLEIGGGYLVWLWLREHRSWLIGVTGLALLAAYGIIPALQPPSNPFGRIYAAYGGVFIVLSVVWGIFIDRQVPDARDLVGAGACLLGAVLMMWPRAS